MDLAFGELDEEKKEFVCSLAAFRTPMDYTAIKAISKFRSHVDLHKALNEILDRGLLFWDVERNKFDLHPVVRSYCFDQFGDKEGGEDPTINDFFSTIPKVSEAESIDDPAPVIKLYYRTVNAKRYEEALELFDERLVQFLSDYLGEYPLGVELLDAFNIEYKKGDRIITTINNQILMLSLYEVYKTHSGKRFELLKFLHRAYNVASQQKELKCELTCLSNIGAFSLSFGDLENSTTSLLKGLSLIEDFEYHLIEGTIRLNLGLCYLYMKEFNNSNIELFKAINIFNNAFEVEKTLERKQIARIKKGFSFALISLLKLFEGHVSNSIKYATKAERINKKHYQEHIWDYYLLGASYVATGKIRLAYQYLDKAIQGCRRINLAELEALILLELAKIYHLQKKESESLSLATEALEIANRCSYVLQQADIEQFLGEFYLDLGDTEKAGKYLKDCIEHCTHCLRYNEDTKDFDHVKKDEKWWYKPRYEKAQELLSKLS